MRVKNCVVNKEHCPYCYSHDTIMLGSSAALVRGDTHWCGTCRKTFHEQTPAQPRPTNAVDPSAQPQER